MCRGRASNCVFTGQAISVGLPWSEHHWVYFLWLVRLPREGSSDLLSGRQAPGCWCSGSWVEAAIPKTQHTQLLLSCSVHLFQHPLRGHLVFSPPRPPLCPLRTVILQLPARVGRGLVALAASATGEPLLLFLPSPPVPGVPGTGNDQTS